VKFLVSSLLVTVGCAADAPSPEPQPEPQPEPAAPQLRVQLTASSMSFDSAWVNISSVALASANGDVSLSSDMQGFELAGLQSGTSAVIAASTLDAGSYDHLYLVVDSASVTNGGTEYGADMVQHDVSLDLSAQLDNDMMYTVTVDLDPAQSFTDTGSGYSMIPVMSIQDIVATSPE